MVIHEDHQSRLPLGKRHQLLNPLKDSFDHANTPLRYWTVEKRIAAYESASWLRDISPGRTHHLVEILFKHINRFTGVELHSTQEVIAKVLAEWK